MLMKSSFKGLMSGLTKEHFIEHLKSDLKVQSIGTKVFSSKIKLVQDATSHSDKELLALRCTKTSKSSSGLNSHQNY